MTLSAINRLQRLNRPKILVQAARHGVTTHERKSHLLASVWLARTQKPVGIIGYVV